MTNLTKKYELLERMPGEGVKSFRGRQIHSGREVAIHLLPGGHTAENEALLARMRTLPLSSLAKLIEVGEQDATIYVVIEAPPHQHLLEWLSEEEGAGSSATNQFAPERTNTTEPAWPAVTTQAAEPSPVPAGKKMEVPAQAGEFTLMFQVGQAPPLPHPESTQPIKPATSPAPGPGEFTRLFQTVPPPPLAPESAPAAVSPPRYSPQPGEFTELFQKPGGSTNPMHRPNEVSGVFQAPGPQETPRPGMSPSTTAGPGEFTVFLGAPFRQPSDPQRSPFAEQGNSGKGDEFTEFLRQHSPAAMPVGFPPGSGFPGQQAEAASIPTGSPQSGEATHVFSPPPGSIPAQGPPGPSEYTQLISRPPAAPAQPASPKTGAAGISAPSPDLKLPPLKQPLPQMPMPASPQLPPVPKSPALPEPPKAAPLPMEAPTINLVMTAILCLLSFLAGGLLVFLVQRR